MRIPESCAKCLFNRQSTRIKRNKDLTDTDRYIERVKEIIDTRREDDCSPYLIYQFEKVYKELYGERTDYRLLKKEYNNLVLSMEKELEKKIFGENSSPEEVVARAITYARIGNYIDFGAMDNVDNETFLKLFDEANFSERDRKTYEQFLEECSKAKNFLLITDNCGEIVIDKLFVRALKQCFPGLKVRILLRGEEVLNDATMEDAKYVGLDQEAELISNGHAIAGTIYKMLPEDAKNAMDISEVILSKGQANYESLAEEGIHVYYSFLCKCDLFMKRFDVPKFTGMFIYE